MESYNDIRGDPPYPFNLTSIRSFSSPSPITMSTSCPLEMCIRDRPEGTGYRARTRFAKFFNLPELMAMFKEVADIKTRDQLHLPVDVYKRQTIALA